MQQLKGIQNISEIGDLLPDNHHVLDALRRVTTRFNMGGITRILNKVKMRGINGNELFKVLFMFPFLSIVNVRCLFHSGLHSDVVGKKDSYYRFLNNPMIPWRRIVTSFTNQFIKVVGQYGQPDGKSHPRCLIVDDSLIDKAGKKIEFLGKVFDHSTHQYLLGFKFLLLGYWDGKSFLPLNFSVHHEPGKKGNRGLKEKELNQQFTKDRLEESPSIKRIQELSQSKIEVAIDMIKCVITKSMSVDYVLADSWFISDKFIQGMVNLKVHLIGLMKSNRIIKIGKKSYRIDSLPEIKRKQIKSCKKFACQYISLNVTYKGTDLKIFLIRMNGQNTWKTLISTDSKLTFVKTMELYQIRWTIEVFFKDVKQHLNLGGCQSNDFDAHIAHLSLVCMQYTALALIKRIEGYETIGNLLINLKDILMQQTIIKKIWNLIEHIYLTCLAGIGVDWDMFIRNIIYNHELINQINTFYDFAFKGDQIQQA